MKPLETNRDDDQEIGAVKSDVRKKKDELDKLEEENLTLKNKADNLSKEALLEQIRNEMLINIVTSSTEVPYHHSMP